MEGFKILSDEIISISIDKWPYIILAALTVQTLLLTIYYGVTGEDAAAVGWGVVFLLGLTLNILAYVKYDHYKPCDQRVIRAVQVDDMFYIDFDIWDVEYKDEIYIFRKKLEDGKNE